VRHIKTLASLAFIALVGLLLASPGDRGARGQEASGQTKPAATPQKKNQARQLLTITPEREAAVQAFVERNHPELGELLGHLKANQPKQYEQAVKDIYRVTERLAQIQERDPLHYELEVKLWAAQSRVQVLAARLKMGATEEHRTQLREALAYQMDARLAVLKHQRDLVQERVAKMDREITQLETDRQSLIDRQVETLSRPANDRKPAAKQPNKKAPTRAAE
jgi:hypothetical protein